MGIDSTTSDIRFCLLIVQVPVHCFSLTFMSQSGARCQTPYEKSRDLGDSKFVSMWDVNLALSVLYWYKLPRALGNWYEFYTV